MQDLTNLTLVELADLYAKTVALEKIFGEAGNHSERHNKDMEMLRIENNLIDRQREFDTQAKELAALHRKRAADAESARVLGEISRLAESRTVERLEEVLKGALHAEGEIRRAIEDVYAAFPPPNFLPAGSPALWDIIAAMRQEIERLNAAQPNRRPAIKWASITDTYYKDFDGGKRAPVAYDFHKCEQGGYALYTSDGRNRPDLYWRHGETGPRLVYCHRCGGLLPTADNHEGMAQNRADAESTLDDVTKERIDKLSANLRCLHEACDSWLTISEEQGQKLDAIAAEFSRVAHIANIATPPTDDPLEMVRRMRFFILATEMLLEKVIKERDALKAEVEVDDKLLKERDLLLKSIPECPVHGPGCIPWAIEWVRDVLRVQVVCASGPNGNLWAEKAKKQEPPKCEDCKWCKVGFCENPRGENWSLERERAPFHSACGPSGKLFEPRQQPVTMPASPDAPRNEYAGEADETEKLQEQAYFSYRDGRRFSCNIGDAARVVEIK